MNGSHTCVYMCAACCPIQNATLSFFGFQLRTTRKVPSLQLSVHSVRLPVVAVRRNMAVLHVTVFSLCPQLAIVVLVLRLSLLFIAPLILHDVLSGKTRHSHFCSCSIKEMGKLLKQQLIHFLAGIWRPCARWAQPRRRAESAAQTAARWRSRSRRTGGRGSGGTPTLCVWSWTTGQKKNRESSQSHLRSASKAHWEARGSHNASVVSTVKCCIDWSYCMKLLQKAPATRIHCGISLTLHT